VKKKIYCFDIDNVICRTYKSNYKKSKPIKKNIKFINDLYLKGFYIKIFTSRFMGRNNENILKAKKQGYQFTLKQLKNWGVKYNKIIFGKPSYDIFVDDKAYGFSKNWTRYLK
jgi:hypothetical protein